MLLFALLLFHDALRQNHLRSALAFEGRVVAGIAFQFALVDMHNHIHHAIKEVAVM